MVKMSKELDKKDLKILYELERDARQSYGKIAKKVGLSKEVILYRVKNLEKSGIIRGYLTEINTYEAGYQLYPILIKSYDIPPAEEKKMYDYLTRSKAIGWAATCEGSWDLNIVLRVKTAKEVAEFFDDFESKFGQYIYEKAFMHTISLNYLKRNFGLDKERRKIITTEEGTEKTSLSEKEQKFIRAISGNARKPIAELAKEAGISPPTAIAMLKKLEEKSVIQGYRVFTGFEARGYTYHKIWLSMKNMTKEDWRALYTFLSFEPYVLWATRTIGSYDLSIELEVPNLNEFRKFISKLKERFYGKIKKRDSFSVYEEIVLSYYPEIQAIIK